MSTFATYLYGVMGAGIEIPAELAGIDDGTLVSAIEHNGLTSLVSEVSRGDFEYGGPADPAWVISRALQHDKVIETVRPQGPILPVRFGALFSTQAALRNWLSFNHPAIEGFLDHIADKEEWALKVELEMETAFESLIAHDPVWAEKAGRLPTAPGTRYFQEKRLREEARQEIRRRARVSTEMIRQAARARAEEKILVPPKPDRLDIEPVAYLAYLVARDIAPEFVDQVKRAASDAPWMRVLTSGPWPAAHFCPALMRAP